MHTLAQAIKVLQSLMEELPSSMHEAVQWSGTESALQTLLQEYYPYPDSGIDDATGDQNLDRIDVSDASGSHGTGLEQRCPPDRQEQRLQKCTQ